MLFYLRTINLNLLSLIFLARINNDLLMWEPPPSPPPPAPSSSSQGVRSPSHQRRREEDEFYFCKSAFRLGLSPCHLLIYGLFFNKNDILMFCISYCRIWLWGGGASVLLSQPIKEKETVRASVWPRPQSALFNRADRQGSPSSHDWLQGHFNHFIWISYCRALRKSYCVIFFWSCQQPNIRMQLWC